MAPVSYLILRQRTRRVIAGRKRYPGIFYVARVCPGDTRSSMAIDSLGCLFGCSCARS